MLGRIVGWRNLHTPFVPQGKQECLCYWKVLRGAADG
jgi:hypothetical protein